MNAMSLLSRLRRPGGVHLAHHKDASGIPTEKMPLPTQIVLPMGQHIGAPCQPVVKKGDHVDVGTLVGKAGGFVSADIHSGVSGTVLKLDPIYYNSHTTVVVIQPDGQQTLDPSIRPPQVEDRESFLQAVRDCGLVGLGGAGFPTAVKLNPKNLDEVDTLIINAAECEPYITTDYRECMENSWDIVSGVQTVMEFLETRQVIIAIEKNKPAAIAELSRIAASVSQPEKQVLVKSLPARYPQGAEKVLIAACTGRQVPPGKLPADVGCVVMNVTSVAFLARYLKTGMPLVEKRLTVDGSAVAHPKNVQVAIGTPVGEVIAFCGGTRFKVRKLLMGGPMMGLALMDDTMPVLKQNNAILALSEEDVLQTEASPCIRCGRCVDACPMHLVPPSIAAAYKNGDPAAMEKLDVGSCMECGCCSFACPAHRHIVQTMRMAKDAVRRAHMADRA